MALQHVASTAPVDEVAACIREHGYVITNELAAVEVMDCIEAELQPYFDSTPFGHLSELGFNTQRTGSLIARSPAVCVMILQGTFLGAVKQRLSHSATVQLSLTAQCAKTKSRRTDRKFGESEPAADIDFEQDSAVLVT